VHWTTVDSIPVFTPGIVPPAFAALIRMRRIFSCERMRGLGSEECLRGLWRARVQCAILRLYLVTWWRRILRLRVVRSTFVRWHIILNSSHFGLRTQERDSACNSIYTNAQIGMSRPRRSRHIFIYLLQFKTWYTGVFYTWFDCTFLVVFYCKTFYCFILYCVLLALMFFCLPCVSVCNCYSK